MHRQCTGGGFMLHGPNGGYINNETALEILEGAEKSLRGVAIAFGRKLLLLTQKAA